jgi:hypothetical protein
MKLITEIPQPFHNRKLLIKVYGNGRDYFAAGYENGIQKTIGYSAQIRQTDERSPEGFFPHENLVTILRSDIERGFISP